MEGDHQRRRHEAVGVQGKPLYYFSMDKAAGDKLGDGRGMVWHIAKP